MANAEQTLMNMLSPQKARLLDQQMLQQKMQGKNYGGGAMGNFLTAASGAQAAATTGAGMLGQRLATGERYIGENERAQQEQVKQLQAKQSDMQAKLSGKSPEQLTAIYRNALTAGNTGLANTTKALLDSYQTTTDSPTYKNVRNVLTSGGEVVPARFNDKSGRYENINTGQELDVSSIEVDDKTAPMLEAGVITLINDVQTEADSNFFKASSMSGLLERVIKEDQFTSGALGALEQSVKSFLGIGDDETLTKKDFAAFSQVEALKLLPPGSTSNVEFLTALSTVPDENSSKEVIVKYLQANLKAATMMADFNKHKAQFMADNGGLSVGAVSDWQSKLPEDKKKYYFETGSETTTKSEEEVYDFSLDQITQEYNRRKNQQNQLSPLMPQG